MTEKKTSRHEDVANRIVSLIAEGAYKVGDRIPSLRELADSLRVSVNTVREAYAHLEERRYIEARSQSGYFVLNRPEVARLGEPHPATMDPDRVSLCRIYCAYQELGTAPEDACGLGIATLAQDMWPLERLQKATVDAVRLRGSEALHYQLGPGYGPLREQIAITGLSGGSRLSPDEIIVTSGCQEAIYLALSVITRPGDTVAVESPIYFNLLKLMEHLGLKVLEIPCSPVDGMHIETLRFALDQYDVKAVLTIANYHNPTGSLMPDGRKEELVSMLSRRGIPLIEDDIYGELCFSGERPRTCQSFDRDGTVLLCSSFSKTISPGLRIGWISPGRWRREIEELKTLINLGSSSIPQIATALLLQDGGFQRHVRRLRSSLREKMSALRAATLEHFPEGTVASDPAGGMVLWVALPDGKNTRELYKRALERDIVIAPGSMFSLQGRFSSMLRLNAGVWGPATAGRIAELGSLAADLPGSGSSAAGSAGAGTEGKAV